MAKNGVLGEDPSAVAAKVTGLEKELKRIVKAIDEEEDDFSFDSIDCAMEVLLALRDLKVKRAAAALRVGDDNEYLSSCPERFRCPLSKSLMRDPVIIATGQTYDRPFIQKWLKEGHRTCPQTHQVLSHTILTPNHIIREMISDWCENRGGKLYNPVHHINKNGVTQADRNHLFMLLGKMSSTFSEQKAAAKELRLLTKTSPMFRELFGESVDAIPQLLRPLSERASGDEIHPDLQEDLITTLLNLSINESNKKPVAETPMVIPLLVDALKCGTIQTRSNAAATLFTLSALDSNKALIGASGALGSLIDLLDEGHPLAMKDAASAIFNLCIIHENKATAVREGAVSVILEKISDNSHVDELLSILAMLSTHQKAVEELGELRAAPCLLNIIRETPCERNKENCVSILYAICMNDRIRLREMREEENAHRTLSRLAQDGTSRAKRKANGILDRLNRAVNLTHTA
ncbi:hypothetical protein Nepgr_029789 [Nepenthes gracilis]|uniref:RING-type E3 ubiquitin transferase n=1 Tax=Nepenthes gracilis TaxID=150966 RepID=A0AAD3Y5W4_NEPGR|nr:hypothetical protein Nepgr_029789 [Nepenthes gracilis]